MKSVNAYMQSMRLTQNLVLDMYSELSKYLTGKRIKFKYIDGWDENDMPIFIYTTGTVTRLTFYDYDLTIVVLPDGSSSENYLGDLSEIEVIE